MLCCFYSHLERFSPPGLCLCLVHVQLLHHFDLDWMDPPLLQEDLELLLVTLLVEPGGHKADVGGQHVLAAALARGLGRSIADISLPGRLLILLLLLAVHELLQAPDLLLLLAAQR